MIITIRHLRTVPGYSTRGGFCLPKSREWFRAHGLDWRDFVRHGIDSTRVESIDDAFAQAVVTWAHRCEQSQGEQHG